ncbi:hypothetical protein H8356DRAFT_1357683 [Neocallimastix lanati (nom. inval.)]|nr:hypothetical protein H8356DRAFT_1357683 [Neocallimastix sp. JGI-2020a]
MEENLIIDKEILKYDSSHNHPEKEYDVSLSIMKHKIKDGIEKISIPFGIKIKPLYNKISKEMGFICPEYNSIKSQISRNLNKKLPSNVTTFSEIPSKSEYYKTKRSENFMIFKNSNLIIFQSPFQAKLFREYNDDIFVDGTFFIAPKFSYQIFITRTYAKELDTAKTIFPNTNIKYCIWHYKKLCYNEVKNDNNIFIYYKAISNLPFINPEYIFDIYVIIKIKSIKNNYCRFLKFLEYFYKTYLIDYNMKAINKANKISILIERYKNIEAKLIDAKCDRNNII